MPKGFRFSRLFAGLVLTGLISLIFSITAKCDQTIPSDVKGSSFEREIGSALRLGYMNTIGDNSFKPSGKIKAKDFVTCITRGATSSGVKIDTISEPADPNAVITRQEAVKLLVSSLVTPDGADKIGLMCGGAPLYLSDFLDANEVASWAESYFAVAVYKGWLADRYRLYPKEAATREFAAVLLARAFPDPKAYTGLAVYVNSADLKRVQSVQIIAGTDVIYPSSRGIPSFAFFDTPGIASFYKTIDQGKAGRIGPNPLEISAIGTQKGQGGVWQVMVSPEDAVKIQAANEEGIFIETWRIAILAAAPPPQPDQTTSAPTTE